MPKDCEGCKAYMQYIEDHGMEELNRQNAELRAYLTAALAQLADKEGQVCTMKEALQRARGLNGVECVATGGGFLPIILEKRGNPIERCGRCLYCVIDAALTSSTPCPHAKEAERLREAIQWIDDRWASGVFHPTHDFNELRRRARGGGVSTNDMDNPFYDNHIFISWDTRRWKLTWLDRVKIFFHPTYVQINEGYIFYFKMVDGKYYILKYEPFTPDAGKE